MYKEGMEMDAFAHDTDGSVYENAVWPGTSVFPDFTKQSVRSWWGDKTKILLEHGISGIWNDMNEPASFNGPLPDDVQFEYGAHEKVHNIYGHFMAKATYEGLAKMMVENVRLYLPGLHMPEARSTAVAGPEIITASGRI